MSYTPDKPQTTELPEVSILRLGDCYSVATEDDGPELYATVDEALAAARIILLDVRDDPPHV